MGEGRGNLCVVLHQVRSPDNLGAVARLIANFGAGPLILSDPRTYAVSSAERVAVKGLHVLETLKIERTLDDALAGCVLAVGTTSRDTIARRETVSPEEAARQLAQAAERGKVALVLGGEQRGLSDDDLARCQTLAVIPTEPEQPSMNLAQAAAVMLYLSARAFAAEEVTRGEAEKARAAAPPGATLGELGALQQRMHDVLLHAGFLNPQAPEHVLRELTQTLSRSGLSSREAQLWLTAFKQLERLLRPGGAGGT